MPEKPFQDISTDFLPSGIMVIFGGTGDLSNRKLVPGLYDLAVDGLLPASFYLISISRSSLSDEEYRDVLERSIRKHSRHKEEIEEKVLKGFLLKISYLEGSFENPELYQKLKKKIKDSTAPKDKDTQSVFYLATAPNFFKTIAKGLASENLLIDRKNSRIVVEKPFGDDFYSAKELNCQLLKVLDENQIFRIDHYLGKETVQNLLIFRFANGIFEPLWNQKYIDRVEITVSEDIGVGHRAGYFDKSGIVKDVIQNHLLQLLSLVALEPPANFEADSVRNEKVKVLKCLKKIERNEVEKLCIRARYQSGVVGGEKVPGYLLEDGVSKNSQTETYAAFCFMIDNWRWAGVPFFLRAGKRLAKRVTDISVSFKKVPFHLFRSESVSSIGSNVLSFQIQPNEGISLVINSKPPGPNVRVSPVKMDFDYGRAYGKEPPAAYERLLLDSLKGDATLFTRNDEIEEAWKVVDPILEVWKEKSKKIPIYGYEAGTWGPSSADSLIQDLKGVNWRKL